MFSNKFPFIEGQFLSLDCVAWKSFSFEFAQLFQLALLQNVNMLFIPVSQIFLQSARVCVLECACVCLLLPFSCGTQFKLVCLPVVPISKYKPIIKAISITYTYRIASSRIAQRCLYLCSDLCMYTCVSVCFSVCVCSICNCELCLMSIFAVIISMLSEGGQPPFHLRHWLGSCLPDLLTC